MLLRVLRHRKLTPALLSRPELEVTMPDTSFNDFQAALVAKRFFVDGLSQIEIGQSLGISRFKVARLLSYARDTGIVEININMPSGIDVDMSSALQEKSGLARTYVLDRAVSDKGSGLLEALGALAAEVFTGIVSEADVVGVAWGRSLDAMAAAMKTMPRCEVVQLVGGMPNIDPGTNSVDLVRRLGELGGGRVYPLHAPLVTGDAELANQLKRDPAASDTISMFARVTKAFVGIGSWDPPDSSLFGLVEPDVRSHLLEIGAVSDVCANLVDGDGKPVSGPLAGRTIAITAEELKAVPQVVGVAGGTGKLDAIRGALKSGMIDSLVTDYHTALALTREG